MYKLNSSTVHSVVIAGGALSGKTTMIRELRKRYLGNSSHQSIGIEFIGEAASYILANTNYSPIKNSDTFQEAVYLVQLQWEEETAFKLSETYENAWMILDRGCADSFVYPHNSPLLPNNLQESLKRYDYVIFLESVYDQATSLRAGNNHRIEKSYAELQRLNGKSYAVWNNHSNFSIIPPMNSIADRANYVAALLNNAIGHRVFADDMEC